MDGRRKKEIVPTEKCKYCETFFFNDQILTLHMKSIHQTQTDNSNEKDFMSATCDRNYFSKPALKGHNSAVHDKIKNFVCEKCNNSFALKHHLQRHMLAIHEKKKDFECELCDI